MSDSPDKHEPAGDEADRLWELGRDDRADWFVARCAAREGAWAIGDDEALLTFTGPDGEEVLMLWPDVVFARRFADEEGIEHAVQWLGWAQLREELDNAAEAGETVVVFPTPGEDAGHYEPAELRQALDSAAG